MELNIFYSSDRNIMCNVLLLSTLVAGTDILSYFYQTNIYYGQKLDILFLVLRFGHYGWQYIIMVIFYFPNILNWISI